MTAGWVRRVVAAAVILAGGVAGQAFATTGTDRPQPCAVTYTATPHSAGSPTTTTFAVSCTADPQWELTSIEQKTTLRDTTPTGPTRTCHQRVTGTAATQTCSLRSARLHTYLVTYDLKAWGNYAVCLDDGTCDPLTPVEDPACVQMAPDQHPNVEQSSLVLDCTYRQVVTVGAP